MSTSVLAEMPTGGGCGRNTLGELSLSLRGLCGSPGDADAAFEGAVRVATAGLSGRTSVSPPRLSLLVLLLLSGRLSLPRALLLAAVSIFGMLPVGTMYDRGDDASTGSNCCSAGSAKTWRVTTCLPLFFFGDGASTDGRAAPAGGCPCCCEYMQSASASVCVRS